MQVSNVNKLEETNQKIYMYNGYPIRIGIKEHFSRLEIQAYSNRKFQYNYLSYSLSDLSTPNNLSSRGLRGYAYTLAFARRITFTIDQTWSLPVSFESYPINELYNFQYCDNIFEKYYCNFEVMDNNNNFKKAKFKKQVTQLVFKLWLCGYGLLPNLTDNTIDDNILNCLTTSHHKLEAQVKIARFLGFALRNEVNSIVQHVPTVTTVTPLLERELAKWAKLTNKYNTEITKELFSFTFDLLKNCIDSNSYFEYLNDDKVIQRETLNSITDSTWVQYSIATYNLCELLNLEGYETIQECIDGGIFDILTKLPTDMDKTKKCNIKTMARTWLNYYSKTHAIKININRIVPMTIRNKQHQYGEIFSFGAAITLIETLLDSSCAYYNDTSLMDYRCRRACLLELATGQRASSICYILEDCIKPDIFGTEWIFFHKIKNGGSNKVVATPDILQWVDELKNVAPKNKIFISSKEYPFGDNLNEYRLFANKFNDGPLTSSSINKFLYTLQNKIWGDNHPNIKPFSSHDLRRMHAVYMKLKNKTSVDIQEKLAQSDINSQTFYLLTKPIEHQEWFSQIQSKGIYEDIKDESLVPLDTIINKTIELNNKYDATIITKELIKLSEEVKDYEFPKLNSQPIPTGFPLRTQDCNATMMVNCGHTELHCFKCNHYKPDINTLIDHKIEVFRYMILTLFQDKELKKKKDILEREVIIFRSKELNSLINECLNTLFNKFMLTNKEIIKIKNDLSDKSKLYIKKYYKTHPKPSFIEAKNFLLVGDING